MPSSQPFADFDADAGCKSPLWRSSTTSCPDRGAVWLAGADGTLITRP